MGPCRGRNNCGCTDRRCGRRGRGSRSRGNHVRGSSGPEDWGRCNCGRGGCGRGGCNIDLRARQACGCMYCFRLDGNSSDGEAPPATAQDCNGRVHDLAAEGRGVELCCELVRRGPCNLCHKGRDCPVWTDGHAHALPLQVHNRLVAEVASGSDICSQSCLNFRHLLYVKFPVREVPQLQGDPRAAVWQATASTCTRLTIALPQCAGR
mmetsp:Transcript_63777/g.160795  ORF Transcript_63777/g.160795 Transcript_63777/m.160795 type:complete len:208 (-) Transcript_63777:834-1457(-)